ncbi:SAM-dependent methyltransferase [Rhizobium sp. BK650]|uniref:class I SAM-dependent methyltransferase n=1 Tax=Rhizobium sp. BK650 TaxID=2586990 RepID=UPI001807E8D7|nr:class I SAM-dependent methyltransferase [Rhizobium sp. BK650]MBB3656971.1 SAM-dependent methyltransferase [Rhizobium sp. BK650]
MAGTLRERAGVSFEDADVVSNYPYRPSYPDDVYEKLVAIAPKRDCLLDIGCGPGKISRPLSRQFEKIIAIDPSRHMIELGQSLEEGRARNLHWIVGFAEDVDISDRPDLIVAAASIHWMDHKRLFARLRTYAASDHKVAVISGDAPFQPAWEADWQSFLGKWVPAISGEAFDPIGKQENWLAYKTYLDIDGSEEFSSPFEQKVEDFIRCQHSRDTFAPARLADRMSEFDLELREMLAPYASNERLSFVVKTKLVWGSIRP